MKAADVPVAASILKRLEQINKDRCALVLNMRLAGVRVDDSAQTWIEAKSPDTMRAIASLLDRELASEEAALRRRAAQIGLSL